MSAGFLLCTQAEAKDISRRMARRMGSGRPGQVTQYWDAWSVASDGSALLIVRDDMLLQDVFKTSEVGEFAGKLLDRMPDKYKPSTEG